MFDYLLEENLVLSIDLSFLILQLFMMMSTILGNTGNSFISTRVTAFPLHDPRNMFDQRFNLIMAGIELIFNFLDSMSDA
jgi:hypothetical protein